MNKNQKDGNFEENLGSRVKKLRQEMNLTQAGHLPHPMLPQQITHQSVLWYPWQPFHFWQAAM